MKPVVRKAFNLLILTGIRQRNAKLTALRAEESTAGYGDTPYHIVGSYAFYNCRSLEELTVRSEDGGFVSRWAAFYRVLQGELTYQRRVERGESCAAPNERDAAVTQTVTAAVNAKDPLEGERLLLALEFDRLDELVGLHSFDDCALYGYALKLQLLERQRVFRHDEGKAAFDTLLGQVRQQIFSL